MYIPKFNQIQDRALLIEAMRAWSFAVLFGPDASGAPVATHLPLVVRDEGEHGVLEGHFALANPHWKSLAGRETLVVFSGPHSYVSPSLYVEPKSVPTWNYIAVHATGTLHLIEDATGDPAANFALKDALLKNLIAQNEPAYADQWNDFPIGYRISMTSGIVGFRIPISRIEGKFKLSQNRPEQDRKNVYAAHVAGTEEQQELAAWMNRLKRPGE
ncbi:FMN-binding negative transcriptional regulator [Acidicapsa acidisoli]|uniref:FMN-binding negative transcriptional regulator n=1 Tax=Acidicapsa acidisoli TaxID=1615681 RepID=UPI0021E0BA78|nr:FMN-binding negative transcriptional regulator [Acidicapsa acidisoli]